jgi:hypothetical protein
MSTGDYLVVHYGSVRPCILQKGTDKYNKVLSLLIKPDASGNHATDEEIIAALDIGSKIEEYTQGTFKVDQAAGIVTIDGQEVNNVISERIVAFYKENLPYLPLVHFWRNIQQNPSEESKKHLFLFLEANKMPITHDGCFLGYKRVKRDEQGNLIDVYSSTFCNNVGAVVTMDRNNVNPDRQQTCSVGLHVAAYDYAAHQYFGSDLLEVKVNPKDVVTVPNDYSNQKMRVCRYEVVGINKLGEVKKEHIDKTEMRAKRKLGQKTQKNLKKEIRDKQKDEHLALIASLKDTHKGEEVILGGLTAPEIIEVVAALTSVDIMIGLKDMKNKKGIVKRAGAVLIQSGFVVNL